MNSEFYMAFPHRIYFLDSGEYVDEYLLIAIYQ